MNASPSHLVRIPFLWIATCLFVACCISPLAVHADQILVEGYVTAVHLPAAFEVGSSHVMLTSKTAFGFTIGATGYDDDRARAELRPGAYVFVWVPDSEGQATSFHATKIHIRQEADRKFEGFGVIQKVIARQPDLIFSADGYIIHVTAKTKLSFPVDLSTGGPSAKGPATLEDIGANTWVAYTGKLNKDGVFEASHLKFPNRNEGKANSGHEDRDIQLPDFGRQAAGKVKPFRLGAWFTLPSDQVMQQRVSTIGKSLVPAYQQAMPASDPSKIPFRFYVYNDDKIRAVICGRQPGLILIPKQAIDRLQDDQLAAILAVGIAVELQRQQAQRFRESRLLAALAEGAMLGAAAQSPIGAVAAIAVATSKPQEDEPGNQRNRIALALMSDAHYELAQAPVAWQLLAAKDTPTPAERANLPYPEQSGYIFSVLRLQYGLTPLPPSDPVAIPASQEPVH